MSLHVQLLAATAAVLGGNPWYTQAEDPAERAPNAHVVCAASQVIGLSLRNDSEKNLGEIGDLLVDPASGEIRYAVLDVGGFLGMGEDQRVVPWSFIQITPDEKDAEKCHARTSLTEAQVKSAPRSKSGQRYDGELDRRIEAVFGKDDAWAFTGKGTPSFVWVGHLDGVQIRLDETEALGTIQEVMLAPRNGCAAYLAVDTNPTAGDKVVAVPWSRVDLAYDRNDQLVATTAVPVARFASAPEFDRKEWKRVTSATWIEELALHFGAEPYWKSPRFAGARTMTARKP